MQTEVSVKNPTRAGWSSSYPGCPATSGTGPYSRCPGSLPVNTPLAELTVVTQRSSAWVGRCRPGVPGSSRAGLPLAGGPLDRGPAVDPHQAGGDSGAAAVGLDELHQLRPARTASGPDVSGADLVLLDVG